jgi:hypothetical protein
MRDLSPLTLALVVTLALLLAVVLIVANAR